MKIRVLQFDNYLDFINKSVGSKLFQTVWAEIDGERKDITNVGQYSCALYISSILLLFGLIENKHATVSGLLEDMKKSGWKKIDEPRIGCVIFWEKTARRGSENEHIGFYIGDDTAICNDPDDGVPIERHYTYGEDDGKPGRKITALYWHPKLDEKYF